MPEAELIPPPEPEEVWPAIVDEDVADPLLESEVEVLIALINFSVLESESSDPVPSSGSEDAGSSAPSSCVYNDVGFAVGSRLPPHASAPSAAQRKFHCESRPKLGRGERSVAQ
jgi:hypothetical protein